MNAGSFSVGSRLSDGRQRVVLSVCGDDGKETDLTLSIEGAERLEKEARKARRQATSRLRKAAKVIGYLFLLPALYFGIGFEITWLASLVGWHPMEYNREIFVSKSNVNECLALATKEDPNRADTTKFQACLK